MKNINKRDLDAISAQFRTSAGAMYTKKAKKEKRLNEAYKKNWRNMAAEELENDITPDEFALDLYYSDND